MKQTSVKDYETRLLRVLEHIEAHLDEELKVEELADIAHFSRFHFQRIFKGMTGETLGGYIRRRRLEWAANALQSLDQSITQLALDAGFENSESFSRAFKIQFGISPSQYRRSGKPLLTSQALKAALVGQLNHQARELSIYLETKGRKVMFDVQIKTLPAMRMAYIHHVGPYQDVGPVFDKVCGAAAAQGLFGPSTQMLSLSYDDPKTVDASDLRCDAGLTVEEEVAISEPLSVQTVPDGDYATVVLKGPYDGLQGAYTWLYGQWLPQSGREAADRAAIEVYLTDPAHTKPEDYLTEIRIPLA